MQRAGAFRFLHSRLIVSADYHNFCFFLFDIFCGWMPPRIQVNKAGFVKFETK